MIFPSDETNILSYVAIIKSLIRLNNDAKEIFKKGFEKDAAMLRKYLLYLTFHSTQCITLGSLDTIASNGNEN